MWLDWIYNHPAVYVYLLGCMAVIVVAPLKMALLWSIAWLTKGNIYVKNARKLLPRDIDSPLKKALVFVGMFAFDIALSWLAVLIALGQIALTLLRVIREAFSSTPEEIKRLRFPLMNNPKLPPESVWAHVTALNLKAGATKYSEIASDLVGLPDRLSSFDSRTALEELDRLHAVPPEWMPDLRRCVELPYSVA